MDEYVQLNMNFIRALQSNNVDGALFFANEIERRFPNNVNIKSFRDVLEQHTNTIAHRGSALSLPSSRAAQQDDEDEDGDEDDEASDGDGDEGDGSSSSGEENNETASRLESLPKRPVKEPPQPAPPAKMPTASRPSPQQPNTLTPSIRDFVKLHPSREMDEEVDRMFEDADKQIANEIQRLAAARKR